MNFKQHFLTPTPIYFTLVKYPLFAVYRVWQSSR